MGMIDYDYYKTMKLVLLIREGFRKNVWKSKSLGQLGTFTLRQNGELAIVAP